MSTKIQILKNKKLKSPVLLVGLPGIGLVGKITLDYLINSLKPKPTQFAKITSDSFPPAVHAKNSLLELISDDVYVFNYNKRDYLFLVGPVQPSLSSANNSTQHYKFSETVSNFAKKVGVKEIYTFAGLNIGQKRLNQKPRVLAVTSDEKTKKNIQKKKIKEVIFDSSATDTLISGVAGLLVGIAYNEHKIPGCCFMGETDQKLIFGDQGSAKSVLSVVCKMFPFKIDTKQINKEAKKIEESFNEITSKIKELEKKKETPVSYIR
jgi:uncharacterized protein